MHKKNTSKDCDNRDNNDNNNNNDDDDDDQMKNDPRSCQRNLSNYVRSLEKNRDLFHIRRTQ